MFVFIYEVGNIWSSAHLFPNQWEIPDMVSDYCIEPSIESIWREMTTKRPLGLYVR